MILDAWLMVIRNAIYGDTITSPTHIAIGTGTTASVGTDTALETEVTPAIRKTVTKSKPEDNVVMFEATWATGEANGNDLTEVGAVNASTAGTFANRQTFPAFSKTVSYELRVQIYMKNENN